MVRSKPELPLTVQFLSNGHRIHASYFEGSELDYGSLPLVFIEDGEQRKLISTASVTIPASHALVRVPPVLGLEDGVEYRELGEDQSAGKWIDISNDIMLSGPGSKVMLRFEPNATISKPTLAGTVALYDTLPNLVYRGWPSVRSFGIEGDQEYRLLANGIPLQSDYQQNKVGSFHLSALGGSGETLL